MGGGGRGSVRKDPVMVLVCGGRRGWMGLVGFDVLSDGDGDDGRARLLDGSSAVLSSSNSDESSDGSEELHVD